MSVRVQCIHQWNTEADLHNNPKTPAQNYFVYRQSGSFRKTLYTNLPFFFFRAAYQVVKSLEMTSIVLRGSPDK